MLILIPVDSNDEAKAQVVLMSEAKHWALVDFDEGKMQAVKFYNSKDEIDWADFAILASHKEDKTDLSEEGTVVLHVRDEKTIEEIIDAYRFNDLDEVR